MNKQHKVFLGIGLAILVVLLVGVYMNTRYSQSGFTSYVDEYAEYEEDGMYAMAPEPAGVMADKSSARGIANLSAEASPKTSDDIVAQAQDRLIIKTGSLSIVVDDVRAAIAKAAAFAKEQGGFVVTSNVSEYGSVPSGHVIVRIPSQIFDNGIENAKSLGEVKSEQVNGQDVTEEFVDLGSRLKSLRAAEAQFLEIMKRAVKIEDVLAVQRELTTVRSQIESIEGRRKYLSESAKLSTLTLNFSTDPSALPVVDDDSWKPFRTLKEAARDMVEAFQILGDGLIWLVVYIPVAIAYTILAWILYMVVMKLYKRFKK